MIDRRFLDIRIAIKDFISSLPSLSSSENGAQYILSADLDSSEYPDGKKDCIAKYNSFNDKWSFIKPNTGTTCEVINLSTGEILKYTYISGYHSSYEWRAVGYVGAYTLPYVVDKIVSSHADAIALGRVGLTYILESGDNYAYKVTGTGSSDYIKLVGNAVGEGKKVGVIEGCKLYTAVNNSGTVQFSNNYEYITDNTLVFSKNTQMLYISNSDEGYDSDLIPVNQQRNSAGETTGSLCIERHVFTATEITNKSLTLNNTVPSNAEDTIICYMGSSVHTAGDAFSCYYNENTKLMQISWDDSYSYWQDNSPKADEVAIFQYYKL